MERNEMQSFYAHIQMLSMKIPQDFGRRHLRFIIH